MKDFLAYVCTYTVDTGSGNGTGIVPVRLNTDSGRLTALEPIPGSNPSWMAISKRRGCAYVVNEVAQFEGGAGGGVTSYAIDFRSGRLNRLNAVGSGGTNPAHCSEDATGRFLLVANYGNGRLTVLPIRPDGSLGDATGVISPEGSIGSTIAESAPLGSFARSGHDGSHAHMIDSDPSGRFILSNDLGYDQTNIWVLDSDIGTLRPHNPSTIAAASRGAGPRHFGFHPNGRVFFNLYEEASVLAVYSFEPDTGSAKLLQQVSTLPSDFAGTSFASAIAISKDGKFLYSANRLHNSVAIFRIRSDGYLERIHNEWTRGDYPNHIVLDPTGNFLLVCNRRSDQVTIFRVDPRSGTLTFTDKYLPIGSPNMIVFADEA